MKSMKKSSKLPVQAAPVVRTIAGAPMSNQSGVEPSVNWWDVANKVAGVVGHLL